ncbi:MAG TPA: WXG100 family type VII secretion target [Bacilli bacterium]|nr:WXG100 family type VII secretion target [Bacilli bacterium]
MAKYSIDYSGVYASANTVNSHLTNLDTSLKTFSTKISEIQSVWQGKASVAFVKKMEEKYNKVQTLVNKLHEVAGSLSKIAQRAEAEEAKITSQINNL